MQKDDLTTYFESLAGNQLLTPEYERTLAKYIVDTEVLTWVQLLSHPPVAYRVLAEVDASAEFTKKLAKITALLTEAQLNNWQVDEKIYTPMVKKIAKYLRAQDLDRVHVNRVFASMKDLDVSVKESEALYAKAHRLREEFVKANLRLVVKMARRHSHPGMTLSDLIQEGNLGLIHAVSRFDYKRKLRFSTYACWWIRHAIGRAIADKGRAVRIPVHMIEAQQQLTKARANLTSDLGRPPTEAELDKAAKAPLAKLGDQHRYIMGPAMSLDRPVHDEDDRTFGDSLADPTTEDDREDGITSGALTQQLTALMVHLSPIEQDVLSQRFGLEDDEEKTFREIGEKHDLSRERIRQIQKTALEKLKRAIEAQHRGAIDA